MTPEAQRIEDIATLKTYQHVWIGKHRGELQYEYICTWSDGDVTREFTLPWGRLDGAVELPSTSERPALQSTATQEQAAA